MTPLDPAALAASTTPGDRPARDPVPDAALVTQIVEHHHAYERRAMPYVLALLAKVAGRYRSRNAKLGVLCDAGEELADALEIQHDDEEREIFPALLGGAPLPEVLRGGLDRMGRHHRALALILARIRWLADDFAVPSWGGRNYQVLMEELETLERDLLEHMDLERAVLRSRAA